MNDVIPSSVGPSTELDGLGLSEWLALADGLSELPPDAPSEPPPPPSCSPIANAITIAITTATAAATTMAQGRRGDPGSAPRAGAAGGAGGGAVVVESRSTRVLPPSSSYDRVRNGSARPMSASPPEAGTG